VEVHERKLTKAPHFIDSKQQRLTKSKLTLKELFSVPGVVIKIQISRERKHSHQLWFWSTRVCETPFLGLWKDGT
jgi:hypothetical protein